MRTLSKFVTKRLRQQQDQTGEHPDADLLTAFAEQNVSREERASVLKHLAECSRCREVYALSSAAPLDLGRQSATAKPRLDQWGWRVAVTAAIVCVGIAGLWQVGSPGRPSASHTVNVADKVPTAQVSVTPAAPPFSVVPAPEIARGKQLAKSKRAGAPLVVEMPPLPSTELAELARSATTPNSTNQAPSSIGATRQLVPPAQKLDAPSSTFARALAQRAEVRPNAMFASQSASAARNRVLQLSVADSRNLWSLEALTSDGTIKRSGDGGRTWQTITVDNVTPLYSLSAAGSSVWVGGGGGKLFHSSDDGVSWTAVQLAEEGAPVHDPIVSLDASGEGVRVKTASGLTFVTKDSGTHWRRE